MKKAKASPRSGFTLVEIMIVVAIIALLGAIAIPNYIRARANSQQGACIDNLRQIDGAKQQWALENSGSATATPTEAQLAPYIGHGSSITVQVWCPLDSTKLFGNSYDIGNMSADPTCKKNGSGQEDPGHVHVLPFS